MKESSTKERLIYYMQQNNLKQVDVVNLCQPYAKKYNVKFNKSDISQYVTGRAEPNQDKLYVLSKALNVDVAWLMGYDVPIDNKVGSIMYGEELEEYLKSASKELNLPLDVIKSMFLDLKIKSPTDLSYDNILASIKKYLKNKFNEKWDRESDMFCARMNAFYYLFESIGWNYRTIQNEDTDNNDTIYELSSKDINIKISSEDYADMTDKVVNTLKDELQALIIKSSNIFND